MLHSQEKNFSPAQYDTTGGPTHRHEPSYRFVRGPPYQCCMDAKLGRLLILRLCLAGGVLGECLVLLPCPRVRFGLASGAWLSFLQRAERGASRRCARCAQTFPIHTFFSSESTLAA